MLKADQLHHEDCFQSHARLFTDIVRMRKQVGEMARLGDIEGLADINLVAKVCEKKMDDLRKAYKNVRSTAEKTICYLWVNSGDDKPIKTPYVTCSPDLRMVPKVPSATQEPEEYVAFLGELGVPKEVAEFGALQIKWPGLVEYCTYLAQQGKPTPKGADNDTKHNVFLTKLRQAGKQPISGEFAGDLTIYADYDDGECGVVRCTDLNREEVERTSVKSI